MNKDFFDKYKEAIYKFGQALKISNKKAETIILSVLLNKANFKELEEIIMDIHINFKKCQNCNLLKTNKKCIVCDDPERDNSVLFIVENIKEALNIIKLNFYKGSFYVLGELLNPKKKYNTELLNLEALWNNIEQNNVKEIIIGLSANFEGELTLKYLKNFLHKKNYKNKITVLAKGIPIGSGIDYIDPITLEIAIKNRTTE